MRSSCAAFMTHPACEAKTHPDLIPSFLASVDEARYREILRREAAQLSLPLKFDSPHQRLNFFAVLHLLNFGSGYRSILKAANGGGAFENIIKLLVAIHVDDDDKRISGGTGSKLDAAWMEAVDAGAVGEWMRVDMTVERAVPENPILKQLVPSPAAEVVRLITAALNETGAALRGPLGQHADLMDFVRHCVARNSDVDGLFASLAALPVLDDAVTLDRVGAHHGGNTDGDGDSDGLKVCIYKKIQVMLSELMRNGFEIPYLQKADLTIFSDNVIPTYEQSLRQECLSSFGEHDVLTRIACCDTTVSSPVPLQRTHSSPERKSRVCRP